MLVAVWPTLAQWRHMLSYILHKISLHNNVSPVCEQDMWMGSKSKLQNYNISIQENPS